MELHGNPVKQHEKCKEATRIGAVKQRGKAANIGRRSKLAAEERRPTLKGRSLINRRWPHQARLRVGLRAVRPTSTSSRGPAPPPSARRRRSESVLRRVRDAKAGVLI